MRDGQDGERFVSDLSELAQQYGVRIHGYCLTTNHYHLILETPHANLSQAVQWLNVAYATYYNRRHHFCGHLFHGRFKALLLDGGPAVTMRCRAIRRHAAKDRQLAKDLDRLRHTLQNNE